MKEDYLWDKTGEDSEIENLENALRVFRYKETAPPELPAKVLPFRNETPRQSLRFAMAMAACVMFGVIALGVWLQVLKNNMETGVDSAETIKPQNESRQTEIPFVPKPVEPFLVKIENSKQPLKRKIIALRGKFVPTGNDRKETKNIKAVKPDVRLTKEEQYAYDQLMLALSITSSKLKLVKDKVEGIDEKNAVLRSGQ